jgi:CarD family transcriptional regulator
MMAQNQADAVKPARLPRKSTAVAVNPAQTIAEAQTKPKAVSARSRGAKASETAVLKSSSDNPAVQISAPITAITKKGVPPDMTVASQQSAKTAAVPDDAVATQTTPTAKEAAAAVERDAMPPPGPRPMLPQRAIAKAENFKAGDHVVYPTHGVGKVERIAPEEIAGQKLELIHITFDENRMTLRVPVNKARTAGLRKLSGRKQFDEVLAALKGRARIKRTMWSRRAQEYEAKINSGDPMAIAEVVRDLHRNAGQPDQSFSERQIFEAALERLAAEYGALEGLGKQEAIDKLLLFLKTEQEK